MGRVRVLSLAAAALVAAGCGGEQPSSIEAELERCAVTRAENTCFDRVYADAADDGKVARTLVALQSLSRAGKLDDCHLQAHRLAHVVYGVVGTVERAFLLGGPQCRLGYLHGAVEASGAQATAAVPVPPCERFRIASERSACAHGYGHALMLRNRHDIRTSLEGCGAAADAGLEREPCELGVMMENSLRYAGMPELASRAARGCDQVRDDGALGRACIENVGIVAALSVAHDRQRAFAICDDLASSDRVACVRGVATEISEASRGR